MNAACSPYTVPCSATDYQNSPFLESSGGVFEIDGGSCVMLLGTCLGVLDLVARGGMLFIMER